MADYLSGHESFFAVFYLAPITFVTWYLGPRWGLGVSIICAGVWLYANSLAGMSLSHVGLTAWNTLNRLAVFLLVTFLLGALRDALKHERRLARTDDLTGAINRRYFNEVLAQEVLRLQRYARPFSLAYMDIDDFKKVNDTSGHAVGDMLLLEVVGQLRTALRPVDTVARLGGDEFAVLMPETDGDKARATIQRLRDELLAVVKRHAWPVSFSFGVVTCAAGPTSPDAVLRHADRLMYEVKLSGKDGFRTEVIN